MIDLMTGAALCTAFLLLSVLRFASERRDRLHLAMDRQRLLAIVVLSVLLINHFLCLIFDVSPLLADATSAVTLLFFALLASLRLHTTRTGPDPGPIAYRIRHHEVEVHP